MYRSNRDIDRDSRAYPRNLPRRCGPGAGRLTSAIVFGVGVFNQSLKARNSAFLG